MPDAQTKDADLAAIKARCDLNYTIASHPKFAGNRMVMAALNNAKASEAAFLAAVAEADTARGFRIWGAYRHCRQACAAVDSAHAALRATIESAENEHEVPSENVAHAEISGDICRHFRGKPNTKAILEEKAEVAAHFVIVNFDFPFEVATSLSAKRLGDEEALQSLAETTALLLALLDQSALDILGADKRALFMDALEPKVVDALKKKFVEPEAFRKLLNKRYDGYSQYYPWLRDSKLDALFMEFTKFVCSALGIDQNIALTTLVQNQVLRSLLLYQVIEILRLP